MKVSITLETDNAAFRENGGNEVADILESITNLVRDGHLEIKLGAGLPLRDSNGNRVGFFTVKD
jgi:hypothetical protein